MTKEEYIQCLKFAAENARTKHKPVMAIDEKTATDVEGYDPKFSKLIRDVNASLNTLFDYVENRYKLLKAREDAKSQIIISDESFTQETEVDTVIDHLYHKMGWKELLK